MEPETGLNVTLEEHQQVGTVCEEKPEDCIECPDVPNSSDQSGNRVVDPSGEKVDVMQGSQSNTKESDDSSFSPVCPEEGLASRIGLVERGKEERAFHHAVDVVEDGTHLEDTQGINAALCDGTSLSVSDGWGRVPKVIQEGGSTQSMSQAIKPSDRGQWNALKLEFSDAGIPSGSSPESTVGEVAKDGREKQSPCQETLGNGCGVGFAFSCDENGDVCGSIKGKKRKVELREESGNEKRRRRRKGKRRGMEQRTTSLSPSSSSSSSLSSEDNVERVTAKRDIGSEDEQQFCLRWNNFLANITSQFGSLRDDEDFVDVTLACGGMHVKAHRVVLSACSPYFKRIFKSVPYCQHPVVFLEGIQPSHLLSLLAFMYCGEVGVRRGQLPSLLSAAHALQIRGLTEMGPTGSSHHSGEDDEEKVVLSARKQAKAVEKVLKDIGFGDVDVNSEGEVRSGCAVNPSGQSVSEDGTVVKRRWEAERRDTGNEDQLNPSEIQHHLLGNHLNSTAGVVKGIEEEEAVLDVLRGSRVQPSRPSSDSSTPTPCFPPIDVNISQCSRKEPLDRCSVSDYRTLTKETVPKVNSHLTENPLACEIAASLVDVCMGSPIGGEVSRGRESAARNTSARISPRMDERGRAVVQPSWDPGEGDGRTGSHLEPRVHLVTGTALGEGLLKPKEEFVQFGSDVEDSSHVVKPKREYLELGSADGDASRSFGASLVTGSSMSLISMQEQYRPHVLGSPTQSPLQVQQQQPNASPHVPYFVVPSTVSSQSVPPLSRHSPTFGSAASTLALGADGTMARNSVGHLKWEMPRPCPVCRRIYSNNSNLRRHLRTIHEEYYETHLQ